MTPNNQLAVVRRWFEEAGGKVTDVPIDRSIQRDLPSLAVELGQARFSAVLDPGGTLVLIMTFNFSPEVVAAAQSLSRENQEKVLLLLKTTLMENPRMGWTLMPSTCTAIGEVTQIQLSQRLRIREEEISTFNRFQDALQEFMTLEVKVRVLFQATFGATPPPKKGGIMLPEKSGIYR